jgi:hypothetical protein
MPETWKLGPGRAPSAKEVALGYIDAFDPDILVQFSAQVPHDIAKLGLRIIKPDQIWRSASGLAPCPQFGIGIFELLNDIFQEDFKYKPKYPVKVVLPQIPNQHSLLWSSFFGEIPSTLMPILRRDYFEPLEAEVVDFQPDKLQEITAPNTFYPRRICDQGLQDSSRSGFRSNPSVFFLDATKVDDVIDFWNLRAIGRPVIPMPKQLKDEPRLREFVIDFLRASRRPWPNNPKMRDFGLILRSRNATMEEMEGYAKSLKIHDRQTTCQTALSSLFNTGTPEFGMNGHEKKMGQCRKIYMVKAKLLWRSTTLKTCGFASGHWCQSLRRSTGTTVSSAVRMRSALTYMVRITTWVRSSPNPQARTICGPFRVSARGVMSGAWAEMA